jgi:hypothetical protein
LRARLTEAGASLVIGDRDIALLDSSLLVDLDSPIQTHLDGPALRRGGIWAL